MLLLYMYISEFIIKLGFDYRDYLSTNKHFLSGDLFGQNNHWELFTTTVHSRETVWQYSIWLQNDTISRIDSWLTNMRV